MKILITTFALGALVACQAPPSSRYAREAPFLDAKERQQIGAPIGVTLTRPAPETPGETLTVDVVIADALARHPALEAALARWRDAATRVDVVTEYPDPVLNMGWMPEPIETRLGPTDARVGIMQRIPWPGRLDAAGRVEAARAEALRLAIRQAAWVIATDVRVTYAELLDVDEDVRLVEDELLLVEGWRDVVTPRFELGQARSSDLVQIDVRAERLRQQLRDNQEQRAAVLGRLNALRARPATTPLTPVPFEEPALDLEVEAGVAAARDRNPEVEARRLHTRAAVEGVRLADLNSYPDVTVGLEYVITGESSMMVPDSGRDAIGLSVSVPIPFRQRGREAERCGARWRARAARQDEATVIERLRGEIATSLHALRENRQRETTWRETVMPLVQRQIDVGLEEYSAGRGTMTDLISYETQRLMVLQDIRRSRTEARKARARLEEALGLRLSGSP
ncbi:MAG: TolC family protein [Dehalococcoidia bacterium]